MLHVITHLLSHHPLRKLKVVGLRPALKLLTNGGDVCHYEVSSLRHHWVEPCMGRVTA